MQNYLNFIKKFTFFALFILIILTFIKIFLFQNTILNGRILELTLKNSQDQATMKFIKSNGQIVFIKFPKSEEQALSALLDEDIQIEIRANKLAKYGDKKLANYLEIANFKYEILALASIFVIIILLKI